MKEANKKAVFMVVQGRKEGTMKKFISVCLGVILAGALLAGCAGGASSSNGSQAGSASESTGTSVAANGSEYKIAMISESIGTEQFILQAYNAIKASAEKNGFEWTSIECVDAAAWAENSRSAAEEGYDLIVGVGWRAGEPFSQLAEEYPDVKFAVIDTIAASDKVKSINFNTAEGCYVLGVMMGTAFPDDNLFGYISNFQDQASFEYRYGFSEGVKSVNPNAQFMFNFVNSYSDTTTVYEQTLQQQAAGCNFIFGGVSSSANSGIYQAALELSAKGTPIYTTGLSVDQTTQDNPYIVSGVLKDTGVCMNIIIDEFLAGDFTGGAQILGIKEKAFGVVGITTETQNFRNEEIITDEVLAAGHAAEQDIISGKVVIEVPMESEVK